MDLLSNFIPNVGTYWVAAFDNQSPPLFSTRESFYYVGNNAINAGSGSTYQISYNINGGSGLLPNNSTHSAGATNISLNNGGSISRDGFSLSGWSLNGNAPGSFTYAGPLNGNLTMVAVWTQVIPPTGLAATPGDARVTVTWNTLVGVNYTLTIVGHGEIPNATSGIVVGVTAGTPTLVNGTQYNFAVKAVSNGIDSAYSNQVSATPTAATQGAVCFLGSAPVQTPAGWARIDSLAVGDLVRTADGRDVAVQRVKHQRIEVPSAAVNPFVIPAGRWGATENLAISPRHAVAVPGRGMVEARFLGLKQMPMRAAFDYYNLELPEWDNMVVAGVEVESLAPKKRVALTVAEFATLASSLPAEKRAGLIRLATVLADGKVAVSLTRKERRIRA